MSPHPSLRWVCSPQEIITITADNNNNIGQTTSDAPAATTTEVNKTTPATQAIAPAQSVTTKQSTKITSDNRMSIRELALERNYETQVLHSERASMAPVPSSLKSTMEVPYLLATVNWPASAAAGTQLWTGLFPDIIQTSKAPILGPLSTNTHFITDFQIKVMLNSTPFNVGRCVLTLFPMDKNWNYRTRATYQNNRNLKIDAANSTTGYLDIPFQSYVNFMSTNSNVAPNTFARVALTVIQPLEVATGAATSVNISLLLMPVKPKTYIPIARHDPILSTNPTLALPSLQLNSAIIDALEPLSEMLPEPAGQIYKIMKHKGTAGDADYPTDPAFPNKGVCRGAFSKCFGSGMDPSEPLDIRLNEFKLDESNTGIKDRTKITELITQPAFYQSVTWSSSMNYGATITNHLVTPLLAYASVEELNVHATPTNMAYFAKLYRQWAGSMEITIDFVGAATMSGRLLVAWIPNVYLFADTPPIEDASNYPCWIIDVQGETKTWTINIPYATYSDFKLTNNVEPFGLYSPDHPLELYAPTSPEAYNGRFVVYVLTPLSHPSNTADRAYLYFFAAGGQDMRFRSIVANGPRISMEDEPTENEKELPALQLNSAEIETTTKEGYQTTISSVLADKQPAEPLMNGRGGIPFTEKETIMNVDELDLNYLLSRPWVLGRQLVPQSTTITTIRRAVTPMQLTSYDPTEDFNIFGYCCLPFVFWSGNIKYHTTFNSNMTQSTWTWHLHNVDPSIVPPTIAKNDPPFKSASAQPTVATMAMYHQQIPVARSSDFASSIPFKSHYRRLLVEKPVFPVSSYSQNNGTLDITCTDVPAGLKFVAYYGAGDNFSLQYYVSPPVIYYAKQEVGDNKFL